MAREEKKPEGRALTNGAPDSVAGGFSNGRVEPHTGKCAICGRKKELAYSLYGRDIRDRCYQVRVQ